MARVGARCERLYHRLWRRLSDRGDSEHEQALVRLVIVGLLVVYALVGPMPPPVAAWWAPSPLGLAAAAWLVALGHFLWIVADPAVRESRRVASMVFDHAATVVGMAVGGAATALLYPLLLWITLGHGFRYGRAHLVASAAISVVFFGLLVLLHPYWRGQGGFNVGLVLALILIPGYCLRLLGHLHQARRRAEASSEAKSRFLATMSHELRTPLHAILGMAELLRGTALGPEQRDMTRSIHTAGHGLLNMIDDVLDLARIEAGAERFERERVDLHRLLHEVRDMLAHRARGKGLAFRLRLDPSLPAEVDTSTRAVHQILVNLATNAIKFTDAGEVRIDAALSAPTLGGAATLRLVVADTGCGIPPQARARVFESFAQADQTTTRRHGGTGLGLAIVKRVVDGTGGEIRLESEVGRGTRFVVELPVAGSADVAPSPHGLVLVHGRPSAAQRRMLDAVGTPWRPAAAETAGLVAAATVDLWCAGADPAAPVHRGGRDLVVWGEAGGEVADAALVRLGSDAELVELRRAVRAASVVADEIGPDTAPVRVTGTARSLDVLVADDHDVNRRVIERMLTQAGHRAILAESGEAALARLEEAGADVVVLDLNMPGISGLEVARRLVARSSRPRLVALTADATAATREACVAAGFDAFLTKPVDGGRLLGAVDTLDADGDDAAPAAPAAPATTPVPAEAEVEAAPAAIDHSRLELLRQLDQGDAFLAGIIDGFVEDGRALILEIEAAAGAGDLARFRDAAHALRSAATHLGATALFERCLAVKGLDAEALQGRAPELGRDLHAAFERAADELIAVRDAADAPRTATPPSAWPGSVPAAPSCADPEAPARAPVRPTAR
ncbi:MAG: response regulator [Alphaproteobacteria bacterium]|nr:response regulator [Alphaproteobacteria bacterium]